MFCLRLAPCGPYLHMHTIRSDLSMIVFFFCFRSFRVVISHMYVLNSTCNLVISTVIFWCSNLENGHLNPCSDSSSCYDFFTSVPIACVNLINYVLAVTVNCLHGVSPLLLLLLLQFSVTNICDVSTLDYY